jgi:hypothetical protein
MSRLPTRSSVSGAHRRNRDHVGAVGPPAFRQPGVHQLTTGIGARACSRPHVSMPDIGSRSCSGSDTRASTDAGRARVAAAERARRQKQVASKHWRLPAARPSRSRATIALRLIERWCRTIAMPHESSHDTRATGKGVIQQRALYGRRGSYHAPAVVGAYDRFRAEVAVSPASASASTGWSGCRLVTTRRLRWRPPRGG